MQGPWPPESYKRGQNQTPGGQSCQSSLGSRRRHIVCSIALESYSQQSAAISDVIILSTLAAQARDSRSPSLGAVAVFHCRRRRLTSSLSGPVAEDCSTSSGRLGGEQNQKFIRHLNEKFTERLKRLDEKFAKRLKTFNYLKGTPIHLQ